MLAKKMMMFGEAKSGGFRCQDKDFGLVWISDSNPAHVLKKMETCDMNSVLRIV